MANSKTFTTSDGSTVTVRILPVGNGKMKISVSKVSQDKKNRKGSVSEPMSLDAAKKALNDYTKADAEKA